MALSISEIAPKFASNWIKGHRNLWMYPKDGKQKISLSDVSRALTGRFRVFPDFIIIGAQKAGTTSLYNYLVQHPNVHSALHKEIHFFDRNFDRGIEWYRANFPTKFQKFLTNNIKKEDFCTGEATPDYMIYDFIPKLVHSYMPFIKIIVLLRNPIDRAYSHYNMRVNTGDETLSFEDAIRAENSRIRKGGHSYVLFSYLKRGHYSEQLKNWLRYFSINQIKMIESDDLENNSQQVFDDLCNFLKLKKIKLNFKKYHIGKYNKKMNPETRNELRKYFQPYNDSLYNILGRDFNWN